MAENAFDHGRDHPDCSHAFSGIAVYGLVRQIDVLIHVVIVVGATIRFHLVFAALDIGREVLTVLPIPADMKTYRSELRIPFEVVD